MRLFLAAVMLVIYGLPAQGADAAAKERGLLEGTWVFVSYVAGDFMMHRSGGVIIVWDTADGKRWRTVEVSGIDPVLAFRGDTTSFVVGEDGLELYQPDRGDEPVATFRKPVYPAAVAFRDDGKTLAAVGNGDGLVVIDVANGREKRVVDRPDGREIGYSVPSPDWSLVASVTKGGVLVWPSGLGKKRSAGQRTA